MNQPFLFQEIIMTLQRFWGEQGCLIWQPYYTQVGAGTNNPATYLRVLGPEPWHVGYVEPSIRPDDGRYGENPNRLQQHTQFQVILKPDPGNPQELYLKSLHALGIDPRRHDIRFIEDNWESPALGAWGLGWEVWLDGQEITQYTYFQQAGGIALEPVSVEITYGLERIAMTLQRVRHFKDIQWSPERKYGDVHLQGEREHCTYYFEKADVERVHQMLMLYEAEANMALEQGLVLPAYDYILKCSHTFNILDARGAVGVTERQAMFGRMRALSRRVAEAYLQQRETMDFPWLAAEKHPTETPAAPESQISVSVESGQPADFLLEIGTEELPAGDLDAALAQLEERVPLMLDELRLEHGEVKIYGTPRRLVVFIKNLAAQQPDRETQVKGPPANRTFDPAGQPTKAAEGFARSRGVDVSTLRIEEIDGGHYAVAQVFEPGRPAGEILALALPELVAGLHFDRAMRWNASGAVFSRPVRWLLALHGKTPVVFRYAGLTSGRTTRGLRFIEPAEFEAPDVPGYFEFIYAQGILLDPQERREMIKKQVRSAITALGGDPEQIDENIVIEVANLNERPTALSGHFDPAHLELPEEVLVSVMKKHQRYFPVYRTGGGLLPNFVAVRNGDDQFLDVVADGNEQVIRARFADAAFFISEDMKHKLEDFLPRLDTLVFQVKLGSMLDKTKRIEKLVEKLAAVINLDHEDIFTARRAAHLCKADLVTHMVIEMTSLQGIMGRHYARLSAEPEGVAMAVYDCYLPRFAGDDLAQTPAGLLVGTADRLDTLAGLFAAGLAPTGTKDPFAQRRAALGLVQNLIGWDVHFDLRDGLKAAAANLPIEASAENQAACFDFIVGRLQNLLIEQGFRYDVVTAVLPEQGHDPAAAYSAAGQLTRWIPHPEWHLILPAYARCVRITRDQPEIYPIDPAGFVEEAEMALLSAILQAENEPRKGGPVDGFFTAFIPMIPVINRFFEAVMVMVDDPTLRNNRLGLLQRVAALAHGVADFSRLEGF